MTSSDRLKNRTRRDLPGRSSSLRNSASGTTSSNRPTDATYFLHITKAQREAEIEESWRQYREDNYGLKDSLTPGAKQLNWKTPTEFLLCPAEGKERTLQTYLDNLVKGKVFTRTQYGDGGVVLDCGINDADKALYVLTQNGDDEEDRKTIKPWALCKITLQDGSYVHENQGSFFHEDGGQKYFTLAMGREWTGGDVMDDFC